MRKKRQQRGIPQSKSLPVFLAMGAALILIAAGVWYWTAKSHDATKAHRTMAATYVGEGRCAQCHEAEAKAWGGSHHAQAMQTATNASVLGDFKNARFAQNGSSTDLFKRNDKFYVKAAGPDGNEQDFELAYTFGVYPLQQYLVPFPGGRLQSFVLAWDSRDRSQNGQRWFDLYPDQKIRPGDPLHWTGRNQTWNYMCAECHSTNLRRN